MSGRTTFGPPDWDPPRLAAAAFAAGGLLWGAFLLALFGRNALALPFVTGYFVTTGYLVRAAGEPSTLLRRIIWATSAIVQGGWLLTTGIATVRSGFSEGGFGLVVVGWWAVTSGVSAWAVVTDRRPRAAVVEP